MRKSVFQDGGGSGIQIEGRPGGRLGRDVLRTLAGGIRDQRSHGSDRSIIILRPTFAATGLLHPPVFFTVHSAEPYYGRNARSQTRPPCCPVSHQSGRICLLCGVSLLPAACSDLFLRQKCEDSTPRPCRSACRRPLEAGHVACCGHVSHIAHLRKERPSNKGSANSWWGARVSTGPLITPH